MGTRLLLAFTALLCACAQPGVEPAGEASASSGATGPDAQLMRALTQANLAEIAAGKLAVEKARSSAVRQFGEHMVNEHIALQTEGSGLASDRGLRLPTTPDPRQQAALRQLQKLSGESFERAYLEQTVSDHAASLALLERAAGQTGDARLRALVRQALPQAREHLERARRLSANHLTSATTPMR